MSAAAAVRNREGVTRRYMLSMGNIQPRNRVNSSMVDELVEYLASHAGRWVPGSELADALYSGLCAESAPRVLVNRARAKGFAIESGAMGYRVGRSLSQNACGRCGRLQVRYGREWVCYGCPSTAVVDLEVGRAGYEEGSQQGKAWKAVEVEFAWLHRAVMGYEELGAALDRSPNGVRGLFNTRGWAKPYVRRTEDLGLRTELCTPAGCVDDCEAESEGLEEERDG